MRASHVLPSLLLAATALLAGCNLPAQLVWSPDGSRAAYRVGADAYLIERTGAVVQKLGTSTGGFAWSPDGKRLYYALAREDDEDPTPPHSLVRREWLDGPVPPTGLPPQRQAAEICLTEKGQSRLLCRLPGLAIHASLSSDEAWLAVLVTLKPNNESNDSRDDEDDIEGGAGEVDNDAEEPDSDEGAEQSGRFTDSSMVGTLALYAVSIRSGESYLLGYPASVGVTFTAPGRLAYLERGAGPWTDQPRDARLVEVALDSRRPRLRRGQPYGDVGLALWMRPLPGGDLLILSVPWAEAEAAAAKGDGSQPPATLYRFARATGKLQFVADHLAPLLSVSPDGRRLLAARMNLSTEPDGEEFMELVLMNTNGSQVRVVRVMEKEWLTMWPSWRDANHFLLPSAESVSRGETAMGTTTCYAIEEYRAERDGRTAKVGTLSAGWNEEMLPYVQELLRKVVASPTTEPATQPAAAEDPAPH